MNYKESIDILDSLIFFTRPCFESTTNVHGVSKGISLERQKLLLAELGNPEKDLKVILIAGTSGKGSTATMLAHLLHKQGHKAGLYISPHLSTPRERMVIGGRQVSRQEFANTFSEIWDKAKYVHENYTFGMPSYFEIMLAMAIVYFRKQRCEFAVLEAGLGGKLDGVNAVKNPVMSIIMPIDKDHVEVLGKTYKAIALDKAHIMRKGKPVIISNQRNHIGTLLTNYAEQVGAVPVNAILPVNAHIQALNKTTFSWGGEHLVLPLTGTHYAENAAVALTAISHLCPQYRVSSENFDSLHLAGRSECIGNDPTIILDAAHNPHKVQALVESLRDIIADECGIVFTALEDKKAPQMIEQLSELKPRKVWISKSLKGPRKTFDMVEMKNIAQRFCSDVELTYSPKEALESIQESGLKYVIVTGSIYYLGEVRKVIL
jgi:dihydrofolate synthase/folylpolyglutamate synthase